MCVAWTALGFCGVSFAAATAAAAVTAAADFEIICVLMHLQDRLQSGSEAVSVSHTASQVLSLLAKGTRAHMVRLLTHCGLCCACVLSTWSVFESGIAVVACSWLQAPDTCLHTSH